MGYTSALYKRSNYTGILLVELITGILGGWGVTASGYEVSYEAAKFISETIQKRKTTQEYSLLDKL